MIEITQLSISSVQSERKLVLELQIYLKCQGAVPQYKVRGWGDMAGPAIWLSLCWVTQTASAQTVPKFPHDYNTDETMAPAALVKQKLPFQTQAWGTICTLHTPAKLLCHFTETCKPLHEDQHIVQHLLSHQNPFEGSSICLNHKGTGCAGSVPYTSHFIQLSAKLPWCSSA